MGINKKIKKKRKSQIQAECTVPRSNAKSITSWHLVFIFVNSASADSRPEGSCFLQILHQVLHVIKISSKQRLFLIGHACVCVLACMAIPGMWSLAGTAVGPRTRHTGPCRGIAGGLGHQIEVEELDQFELDLSRRCTLFEQRSHGEQAIERFKGACVRRVIQQSGHERQKRSRLDRGAVDGIEQVEKKVHVDFSGKEGSRRRV